MFRPAFVAIVRLQSSSVKSLYNMLKGRLMMRSQSSVNYDICNTQQGCLTSKWLYLFLEFVFTGLQLLGMEECQKRI